MLQIIRADSGIGAMLLVISKPKSATALNSDRRTVSINNWFALPFVILREKQTNSIIKNRGTEHISKYTMLMEITLNSSIAYSSIEFIISDYNLIPAIRFAHVELSVCLIKQFVHR